MNAYIIVWYDQGPDMRRSKRFYGEPDDEGKAGREAAYFCNKYPHLNPVAFSVTEVLIFSAFDREGQES